MTRTRARRTQSWPVVTAGVLAAVLCSFIAFGAAIPMLPGLVLGLGGGPLAIGLTLTASSLVCFFCRPSVGRLAQRFGCRIVMLWGCLLAAAAGALYAVPGGLAALFAARVTTGLADAALFTAGAVWVVALAPESRRGQVVGWYGLAGWGGIVIGPVIGELLRHEVAYPAVWWFAGLLPLVAVAVVALLVDNLDQTAPPAGGMVPKAALLPGVALFLAACGYSALFGFVALHLQARGVPDGAVLLSVFSAAYVTTRLAGSRLPDRLGATALLIGCTGTEALGLAMVTFAHAWWLAAVGTVLMGAGLSMVYPTLALHVINRAGPEQRGAAIGAYTSFWDLGLGGTGFLAGAVAGLGYGYVFGLATALAVAAGAVGMLSTWRAPKPSRPATTA